MEIIPRTKDHETVTLSVKNYMPNKNIFYDLFNE